MRTSGVGGRLLGIVPLKRIHTIYNNTSHVTYPDHVEDQPIDTWPDGADSCRRRWGLLVVAAVHRTTDCLYEGGRGTRSRLDGVVTAAADRRHQRRHDGRWGGSLAARHPSLTEVICLCVSRFDGVAEDKAEECHGEVPQYVASRGRRTALGEQWDGHVLRDLDLFQLGNYSRSHMKCSAEPRWTNLINTSWIVN